MNRNIWKQTALAVALSAATGLAFAQATHPAAGSHTSKTDDSSKTAGKIISDQTQAPEKGMSTKEGAAANRSGEGAGASQKTAGKIISDQTKPAGAPGTGSATSRSSAASGTSGDAMKGDPSTKTSADIIKNETESPGRTGTSGNPPRSTSSGSTSSSGNK